MAESGLEVAPDTGPEVAPQLDGNLYGMSGGYNEAIVQQSDQSNESQMKSPDRFRAPYLLAVFTVVCLALGFGLGLGIGFPAKHKSSLSRATISVGTQASSNTPATIIQPSNASVIVTQSDNAPTTIAQPGEITTIPPTHATISSPVCPAANGSTYIATNKPLPTVDPKFNLQIPQTSLSFEILCYTNLFDNSSERDMQILTNVSSLNECLDQCALYNFRVLLGAFATFGCTGVSFGTETIAQPGQQGDVTPLQLCWLKNNVTFRTDNQTARNPGFDGAVLLGFS